MEVDVGTVSLFFQGGCLLHLTQASMDISTNQSAQLVQVSSTGTRPCSMQQARNALPCVNP